MADDLKNIKSLGCRVSEGMADFAARPYVQIGFVLFCLAWLTLNLRIDILTACLSIFAITLTQMVLNKQEEREKDAHRRDVALHAKLDELLHASRRARDELAGIEELEEEEIERLRDPKVAKLPVGAARKAAGSSR